MKYTELRTIKESERDSLLYNLKLILGDSSQETISQLDSEVQAIFSIIFKQNQQPNDEHCPIKPPSDQQFGQRDNSTIQKALHGSYLAPFPTTFNKRRQTHLQSKLKAISSQTPAGGLSLQASPPLDPLDKSSSDLDSEKDLSDCSSSYEGEGAAKGGRQR